MITKKRPSLRNTKQTAPFSAHAEKGLQPDSNPTPRGMMVLRCKQVSRLGFYLLAHLPAFAVVSCCAFVSFTVTGIARKFHPIPMTFSTPEERRASLRRYTGYSFVMYHYKCIHTHSQSVSETFALLLEDSSDTMNTEGAMNDAYQRGVSQPF